MDTVYGLFPIRPLLMDVLVFGARSKRDKCDLNLISRFLVDFGFWGFCFVAFPSRECAKEKVTSTCPFFAKSRLSLTIKVDREKDSIGGRRWLYLFRVDLGLERGGTVPGSRAG